MAGVGEERLVVRLGRAFRALCACTSAVTRAAEELPLLEEICRVLVDLGGYRMAWVGYAEAGDGLPVVVRAHAGLDEGYLEEIRVSWGTGPLGSGPTGTAIRTAEPAVNRDTDSNPDYGPWRAAAQRHGFASSISLPLAGAAGPFGALTVYASQPEAFDEEERALLLHLAGALGFGIEALRTRALSVAAQRELERKEAQLRQAAQMEALGQLACGVAHDFNNLLSVMQCCADLACGQLEAGHPARTELEEIRTAGRRASDLSHRLLAFGRRRELAPAAVSLARTVRELEPLLRRTLGGRVVLAIRAPQDLWLVEADPGQLEQLVLNLSVNARDAMPDGGELSLTLSNVASEEAQPADGWGSRKPRGKEWVALEVRDTGEGMSPEVRARIFEPLYTTKPPGRGSGLGLPIVASIAKNAGGSVSVDSKPGRGTSFVVKLPRAAAKSPTSG
jgi:signal transduction histidine kinase